MTKIQLQLTDRDKGEQSPRECPKCGDLRETPWHDQDCSYRPELDKGEQCVYCGKDSWTCEHFEESNRDSDGSLADYETDAERNR